MLDSVISLARMRSSNAALTRSDLFFCPKRILGKQQYNATKQTFGRGHKNQTRPGNVRFRLLIDMHMTMYEKTPSRLGKTKLFEKIIDLVQKSNGRFLRRVSFSDDNRGWVEETDFVTVRNKIAHGEFVPGSCLTQSDSSSSNRLDLSMLLTLRTFLAFRARAHLKDAGGRA